MHNNNRYRQNILYMKFGLYISGSPHWALNS
jgi:hypothetical protein